MLCLPLEQSADGQGQHPPLCSSEAYLMNAAPVHRYTARFSVLADLPVLNSEAGKGLCSVTL